MITREDYIKYRKDYIANIMYEHYKEHFDAKKHTPFLTIQEFQQYMQIWPYNTIAINETLAYYDAKFNVMMIPDRQGNILRYE